MKIIDLTKRWEKLYFNCLTGNTKKIEDAGDYKKCWYFKMKQKGLKVKIALTDNGEPGGMIQYLPSEESFIDGDDLYFANCIWVAKDKKYRGNFQKKGMGKALLCAFEEDARQNHRKGVAVWGLTLPVFMEAGYFKRHGYKVADKIGIQVLLWKQFHDSARTPRWIRQKKMPEPVKGQVTVTCFINGWCPEINKAFTRAKKAVSEFEGNVRFIEIDTSDRKLFLEWGINDALFIDNKEIPLGPAPSYKKIVRTIQKQVKKQGRKPDENT